MTVQKFRSFDEARRALIQERDEGNLPARIAALWDRSGRLTPPLGLRGVRKYRSLEEADADRLALITRRGRIESEAPEVK